jgi:hypothetical protein
MIAIYEIGLQDHVTCVRTVAAATRTHAKCKGSEGLCPFRRLSGARTKMIIEGLFPSAYQPKNYGVSRLPEHEIAPLAGAE